MGVPSFFRWISEKYPKIISPVVEEEPVKTESGFIPVDVEAPNPNGEEFDNLYLDLNGIVHPCCHPEDKEAPETEDEMMIEIFRYIDRIMNFIRPRKLLYIAIDGVAPRAKMNQQRSRRFKAGHEARIKKLEIEKFLEKLKPSERDGVIEKKNHFDSNCITPGTPFMDKLSESLKYYIANSINTKPGWKKINVIFSDASVPGEGEHKIMDFIRKARNAEGYDPNTYHVLYGLDADLIMLSLATHEPRFKVLREDVSFKLNSTKNCSVCNKFGHTAANCRNQKGVVKEANIAGLKPFILLHVNILREYLEAELVVENLKFKYDFENAIDDWIFLIFFVGNDFLPHLPCLQIFEGAVDKLVKMWKDSLNDMGGFITKDGEVNLKRAQIVLLQLAELEDQLLDNARRRNENRNLKMLRRQQFESSNVESNTGDQANHSIAKQLKDQMTTAGTKHGRDSPEREGDTIASTSEVKPILNSEQQPKKQVKVDDEILEQQIRKEIQKIDASEIILKSDNVSGHQDTIRLGEEGYKDRYYQEKFGSDGNDPEFRKNVARSYIEGLCWVLKYYYQGCPSWKWFYPYHYPPFASDMILINEEEFNFKLGAPLKPFEQLMGVLPADSKQHLPEPFHYLMENEDSPIIDFYPKEFKLDLNGEKKLWKAIVVLPFIEENRLLKAINDVYPSLTPDEHRRNSKGHELLYLGPHNPLFPHLKTIYEGGEKILTISPELAQGVPGSVEPDPNCNPNGLYVSPLLKIGQPSIERDVSLSFKYIPPYYPTDHVFPCSLRPNLKKPNRILTHNDISGILMGIQYKRKEFNRSIKEDTYREAYEHYSGDKYNNNAKKYQERGYGFSNNYNNYYNNQGYLSQQNYYNQQSSYQGQEQSYYNRQSDYQSQQQDYYNQQYNHRSQNNYQNQGQRYPQTSRNYANRPQQQRSYNDGHNSNYSNYNQNSNQNAYARGYQAYTQNYARQNHSQYPQDYNSQSQPSRGRGRGRGRGGSSDSQFYGQGYHRGY